MKSVYILIQDEGNGLVEILGAYNSEKKVLQAAINRMIADIDLSEDDLIEACCWEEYQILCDSTVKDLPERYEDGKVVYSVQTDDAGFIEYHCLTVE